MVHIMRNCAPLTEIPIFFSVLDPPDVVSQSNVLPFFLILTLLISQTGCLFDTAVFYLQYGPLEM